MAWQGNTRLTNVEIVDRLSRRLTFTFADGLGRTDVVADIFSNVTDQAIRKYITDRERQLQAIDDLPATGNTIDTTPPPPEDPAIIQFQANVQKRKKMDSAIAAGDKRSTDADYIAIVAAIRLALTNNPGWIIYYS